MNVDGRLAPGEGDAPDPLADDLARIVTALRTTTLFRLRVRCEGRFASRVDAGRALATALATAAQGIESAGAASMPAWRLLPKLPDLAVGDQVAVTAHDYLGLRSQPASSVWTPSGRADARQVDADIRQLVEDVAALWPRAAG